MATGSTWSVVNEEDVLQKEPIHWISIIFVPYNRKFQLVVLICAFIKILFGPTQAVLSVLTCWDTVEQIAMLKLAKIMYVYVCDAIYGIDVCLHIAHRQVHDEAMRRHYPPKPFVLLFLDVIALLPLFHMMSNELCPEVRIWPNILCFNEALIIYRFIEYFSLVSSHSIPNVCVGSILVLFLLMSYIRVFTIIIYRFIEYFSLVSSHSVPNVCMGSILVLFLLMSNSGVFTIMLTLQCSNCDASSLTSWIVCIQQSLPPELSKEMLKISSWFYSTQLSFEYFFNYKIDTLMTMRRVRELWWMVSLAMVGFIILKFVLSPKIFAEYILSMRRLHSFHPRAERVVVDTRRRQHNAVTARSVEKYYSVVWRQRNGLTSMPPIYKSLPHCMQITVAMDLAWPLFYHSPNLRRTSTCFKRWLSQRVRLSYRMPDERFYVGPQCFTNMYYLKAGVLQVLSADDLVSPLLSVTGGTVFGDVSFYLPPHQRQAVVRCLTYCEVLTVSRRDLIQALHLFPDDRRQILQLTRNRIQHARILFEHKVKIRGVDRSEDEDIAWIKKRWWELAKTFRKWKRGKREKSMTIPDEHTSYHCAKYIGQLVVCSELQLSTNSMFMIDTFPWVLSPRSSFEQHWQHVVQLTVLLVLLVFPPNVTRLHWPTWFDSLRFCCDQVFTADVLVTLVTARQCDLEASTNRNIVTTMLARIKTINFVLDVLSTSWFDGLFPVKLCYFNRFLKSYKLFKNSSETEWKAAYDPTMNVLYRIMLLYLLFEGYVWPYFFEEVVGELSQYLSYNFWLGPFCSPTHDTREICKQQPENPFIIPIAYLVQNNFYYAMEERIWDSATIALMVFKRSMLLLLLSLYLTSVLYLKFKNAFDYQNFVITTRDLFVEYKLHPDLLMRMLRFLDCHWKYFRGLDVMQGQVLHDEPFDIYMRVHGNVAERIIRDSPAFGEISSMLLRDMAHHSRFLILPRGSSIFLFGVKCDKLAWIVKGVVRCEYHDDSGELVQHLYWPGEPLEHVAVLMARPSMRTYTTATDCELLYIDIHEFRYLLRRHTIEHSYYEAVSKALGLLFDRTLYKSIKKHREYQKKLRSQQYRARQSTTGWGMKAVTAGLHAGGAAAAGGPDDAGVLATIFLFLSSFRKEPESAFMQLWQPLRAASIVFAIICSSLRAGFSASTRRHLSSIVDHCTIINGIDILLMFLLPYYDERGLVERRMSRTALRYLSRGFLIDVLLMLPWRRLFYVSDGSDDADYLMVITVLWAAQLYYIVGYFDYLVDSCTSHTITVSMMKWVLVMICLQFSGAHFFQYQCVDIDANKEIWSKKSCWLQLNITQQGTHISTIELLDMYVDSMNFAQIAFTGIVSGIRDGHTIIMPLVLFFPFCFFTALHRLMECILISRLVLGSRGSSLFMHSLSQLDRFLEAERIERPLIDRALSHFGYEWHRNRGLDLNEFGQRVGVLFRQDMNFFFYKQTLVALDTVLHAGEPLLRELAGHVSLTHFLPHSDVVREMDLVPFMYLVHRGKVHVTRHGLNLATLTKGCIFGQLDGSKLRPLNITARTDDYLDLLRVPLRVFHDMLPKEVHDRIMAKPDAARDFITLQKTVAENPYNTIRYIMRGDIILKLPFMREPVEAQDSAWLYRWLVLTHAVMPLIALVLVPMLGILPSDRTDRLVQFMIVTDVMHVLHVAKQFFMMHLVVVRKKLELQYTRLSVLKSPFLYVDLVSLILPYLTYVTDIWAFQAARLLRLYLLFVLFTRLSHSIKTNWVLLWIRLSIVLVLIHGLTCGYVQVSCRGKGVPVDEAAFAVDPFVNSSIDRSEWITWPEYKAILENGSTTFRGCYTTLVNYKMNEVIKTKVYSRLWYLDYLLCLNVVFATFTGFSSSLINPDTKLELVYNIVVTMCLNFLFYWVSATAIISITTKFYELYDYDYQVSDMVAYMTHNQVSFTVIDNIQQYARMLWHRQRGTWMPAMVSTGPLCLREDLYSSLYMHHLMGCPCYRELPEYFRRQLITRVERVILLPGRYIVKEGDLTPRQYFIHEGEVEKWCTDPSRLVFGFSGEEKLMSVLCTTGFFGIVSGLFPECPFSCSYYTRTVVDLVYLRHDRWQDLLNAYPDVKKDLYARAHKFKNENYMLHKKKASDHRHTHD